MHDTGTPTAFLVSAQARIAAQEGIPFVILRKGDPTSGTLLLKINLLNGSAHVFTEARIDNERVWTPATNEDPMPDAKADSYLAHQADVDPDVWLIEIDDKEGRLWFPGKIKTF